MGSAGAIIMGFFGATFFICGLGPVMGWTNPLMLLPLAVFGFIVTRVFARTRASTAGRRAPHAGTVILWSSVGEGIGILIVTNVVINLGRRDLILPGVAAVVGLHFLPMAFAIPFRVFYAVAAGLLVSATAGILLPQPEGSEVAGLAAAAVLWLTSFAALPRKSRPFAR